MQKVNKQWMMCQTYFISLYIKSLLGAEKTNDMQSAVIMCFELLLHRVPRTDELKLSLKLAEDDGLGFVCRALINSNEFVFIP